MSVTLVVRTAFGPFVVGEGITDPFQVRTILSGPFASCVADGTGIVVVPAQPNGLTHVSGPPPAILAASFGYALDDDGHVLYQWIGTLWRAILAGSTASAQQLAGNVPASAGASAAVTNGKAVAGMVPASAAASGTVATTAPSTLLSASAPASAGASATVSVNDNLSGAAPKSAAASGAVAAVDAVSGLAPSSAAAAGAVTALDAISGAAPKSAAASATVTTTQARSYARTFAFGLMGFAQAA